MTSKNKIIPLINKTSVGKICIFPDTTAFPIQSILDFDAGYTQICYFDGDLAQVLWVPNDYIQNDSSR